MIRIPEHRRLWGIRSSPACNHLLGSSAARDSGTSTFIHWDIDQESRPKGDAPDIGADEASFSNLAPILFLLLN